MDSNLIASWFVGLTCVFGLVRILRVGSGLAPGWSAVYAGVFALLLVMLGFAPGSAGEVSGVAWLVLIALPGIGMLVTHRLILRNRFGGARLFARLIALLHPMDGWPDYPRFVSVFERLQRGDIGGAKEMLGGIRAPDTFLGRVARLLSAQLGDDWSDYRDWVDQHPQKDRLLRDTTTLGGYLAALGRLGARDEMLQAYRQYGEPIARHTSGAAVAVPRLSVLSHTGRTGRVEALLAGPLRMLPRASQLYHLGESEQVAGRVEAGAELLRQVLDVDGVPHNLRMTCERRLAEPLVALDDADLSDDARVTLQALEEDLAHESEYSITSAGTGRAAVATWAVAGVLFVVFLVQVAHGGAARTDTLIELGALVLPVEAPYDQWWRVVTAGFLHVGYQHLLLNTVALLLFGRWLERAWGARRLLLCYVLAFVVANALLPLFEHPSREQPMLVFAGASGGIMGVLGGLLGRLLVGRLAGRSQVVRQQLMLLVGIVLVQIVFDASVPQVSGTCHLLGLSTGFVFGVLVARRDAARAQ